MFCRIYTYFSEQHVDNVNQAMCQFFNVESISSGYIEGGGYSLSIRGNKDFDELRSKHFPDGFLHFPFSIELDIEDNVAVEDASLKIDEILKFLWGNNYPAVTACDFEDKLIQQGGYKSLNVPWPHKL